MSTPKQTSSTTPTNNFGSKYWRLEAYHCLASSHMQYVHACALLSVELLHMKLLGRDLHSLVCVNNLLFHTNSQLNCMVTVKLPYNQCYPNAPGLNKPLHDMSLWLTRHCLRLTLALWLQVHTARLGCMGLHRLHRHQLLPTSASLSICWLVPRVLYHRRLCPVYGAQISRV